MALFRVLMRLFSKGCRSFSVCIGVEVILNNRTISFEIRCDDLITADDVWRKMGFGVRLHAKTPGLRSGI